MGYRLRIGKISKDAHKKYGSLATEDDVIHVAGIKESNIVYALPEYQEIWEIGKYVNYSDGSSPFFAFELDDCEFSIVTKEWLIKLINEFHDGLSDYFTELVDAFVFGDDKKTSFTDNESGLEVYRYMKSMRSEWSSRERLGLSPYNLKKGQNGPLASSWKIEYSLFNLVHILHTFDWDKDYLIYSGW